MLKPRIIPCLLIKDKGLVKTVQFANPKYVGDPLNTVRIFSEKQVDELMVLDISATVNQQVPDFKLIERMARECTMPLCYGGGIKTLDQANTIIGLGVEKIALSSGILDNPQLISEIVAYLGRQSVVVVLDIKPHHSGQGYEIWTHNGQVNTGKCPFEFIKVLEELGLGEIVLNAIHHDGMMIGYDLNCIKKMRSQCSIPITALGGAGHLDDISQLIRELGVIGAAAGSLFVFKGKYKAVLANYPDVTQKARLGAVACQ